MKTENAKIFGPLPQNHLLIHDNHKCWICERVFFTNERVCLLPYRAFFKDGVREEKPVHATCAYRGALVYHQNTAYIVDRIRNGVYGYTVVTTDGEEFRFDEVGLDGE